MKKIAILVVLIMVMSMFLTACSFTCDACKRESDGESYDVTIEGEDATLCEDCHALYELGQSMLGGMGG